MRISYEKLNVVFIGFFGVPGGIRTHDLPLRRTATTHDS